MGDFVADRKALPLLDLTRIYCDDMSTIRLCDRKSRLTWPKLFTTELSVSLFHIRAKV